jgi:hypothetical protein
MNKWQKIFNRLQIKQERYYEELILEINEFREQEK